MSHEPTEQSFLKDVAEHKMIVLRDDGIYRHLRFKKPETGCMRFDLVTWPGYLAYSGDMGCYVFSRLNDMFQFFRTDREAQDLDAGQTLAINLSYWSEKLQAVDGNRHAAGAEEFSEEKFARVINEYRVQWMRDLRELGACKDDRRDLWEAVESEVINADGDSGGHRKQCAAHDFSHRVAGRDFYFRDLFEHSFTDYTFRFVWCCYALAWGIQQYDNAANLKAEA